MSPHAPQAPQLHYTGRQQHPAGTEFIRPWLKGMQKPMEELWYVFHGAGKIRARNGDWQSIRSGMLVWFRADVFYEIRQHREHPLGMHFFHFSRDPDTVWEPSLSETLETIDPSFAENLSRRIIELYWEAYIEKVVIGGGEPDLREVPRPRFFDEPDPRGLDTFLPGTMGLDIPARTESDLLMLASDLFKSLLGEYKHLALKNLTLREVGIQRYHRKTIQEMVNQVSHDLKHAPSIPEMAGACGYSIDHFSRVFRKVMGCSPQDFMIRIRTARARQLLAESGMSIKEIAFETGYRTPYYFSRQFKTVVGHSPSAFRQRLLKTGG